MYISGAWSSDGTILIKDKSNDVHRVNSLNDLVPFGYSPPADKPKTDPAPPPEPPGVAKSAPSGAMAIN